MRKKGVKYYTESEVNRRLMIFGRKEEAQDLSTKVIKYKKRYCTDVREYFEAFIGYWERRMTEATENIDKDGPDAERQRIEACHQLIDQMSAEHRLRGLPSFEKWAKKIGVHPSTVSRWRDAHPEFDEACRDCDRIQVDILRDGGLSGIYAGRTATFLIKLAEEREAARVGGGEMRLEDFED